MKQGVIETIVGFAVICVAAFFFAFSYKTSNSSQHIGGYILTASFQNIEGLSQGDDIKLSGIKVGSVDGFSLEKDTYFAVVRLRLEEGIEIPVDSRAIVSTNGLLGGKYVRITPGASDDNLKSNEEIKFTQSALNIEDLIGKLMYAVTSK